MQKYILMGILLASTTSIYAKDTRETLPQIWQESLPSISGDAMQRAASVLQQMSVCMTQKQGQFDAECAQKTGEQAAEHAVNILTAPETQRLISRSRPHLEKSMDAFSRAFETVSEEVLGQPFCSYQDAVAGKCAKP